MDGKNFQKGVEVVDAYSGSSAEDFIKRIDSIAPGVGNVVVDYCFGDVFSRPGIDHKTREMLIVGALTAMGNAEPQLEGHLGFARRAGASREELIEVIVQMSPYAGIPAMMRGLNSAKKVFEAEDA